LAKILIVDDDAQLRQSFEKILNEEGYTLRTASTGEEGIAMVKAEVPDLVIMDLRLPGMDGLEAFRVIHELEPKLSVIIMTAHGTTETAIEATKVGAFDYLTKPFEIPDMLLLINQALESARLMRSKVEMDVFPPSAESEALIGRSRAMQEVYKAIGRVASTDATVLIRGESGTGKELVARAIYQHSLRAEKPFLVINCVAIPDTLLESELFGYEKGAFTGAAQRRVGKVEQAHGGTLFLDEIGDMPFSIQAKILRLLQEKSIERLGGRQPIPVDVRIIAATNRDLERALQEGKFREDLYYRLKVVTLQLPPLHQRAEDIPLLAEYFLGRFSAEMEMENPGITEEAMQTLMHDTWPGNVRELANTIQKALIFSRGVPIGPDDVSRVIRERSPAPPVDAQTVEATMRAWVHEMLASAPSDGHLFDSLMDRFARILVTEALNITGGNRSRAAKLTGLSRPTLLSKIDKYQIQIKTRVGEDEDTYP
jgi:nitrogen regulation protein NR(I)